MKQTVRFSDFINAFRSFEGRYEQLGGYEGLRILFQYLEEIETDSGEEYELDVIALCCDYACQSPEDIAWDYDMALMNTRDMTEDELSDAVMDYLNDSTSVVGVLSGGRILYQQF
jgi:hypothetical protein